MSTITAKVEGDDFADVHEFDTSAVLSHNGPEGKTWAELSYLDRTSLAEDYALWAFYRRYGNNDELRVDITNMPFHSLHDMRSTLAAYVTNSEEAAGYIGDNIAVLANIGAAIADAIAALPVEKQKAATHILDDLVQDCADEGADPDEAATINNSGNTDQIAYLLAYNALETGIEVLKDSLEQILPAEVFAIPQEMSSLGL